MYLHILVFVHATVFGDGGKNSFYILIKKLEKYIIRKNLFAIFFKKENKLLNMLYEIEKPRNKVCGKVIIPKEIKRY